MFSHKPLSKISYSMISFAGLMVLLLCISFAIAVYKPLKRKTVIERAAEKAKDSIQKLPVFRYGGKK